MSDKKINENKPIKEMKSEIEKEKLKKEVSIQYIGNRTNYTRYGKLIPKEKTKIIVSDFFGIDESLVEQRIKDLKIDKDIIIE